MCEVCNTYSEIQVNVANTDPTRTTTLRNAFAADMRRRFKKLAKDVKYAVVNQDVFGLIPSQPITFAVPQARAFAFNRSQDKVVEFMKWLNQQVRADILSIGETQQIGTAIDSAWTNKYVADSYKRGVVRANDEMKKIGYNVAPVNEGVLNASLTGPFSIDRVGVLYTRVFSELAGISANMESQISRVLAQGLIDGDNPRTLANKMLKVINGTGGDISLTDTLGRFISAERRAEIMARTEIIRAHHQGMMQEYRNWGVVGVNVKAEFRTAGDDRVCSICAGMEGNVYTLDEAQNLIPVHPQCRCITLPITPNQQPLPSQFPNIN